MNKLEECVKRKIPIIKKEYPDLAMKAIIKRAYIWCREHGDSEDFTMEGVLTRSGSYEYELGTEYKDWNNLKQIFSEYDFIPVYDGHEKNIFVGMGHTWKYDDEKQYIKFEIDLFADKLTEVSDLKEAIELPVSLSFSTINEYINDKNIQNIWRIDHIALALNKEFEARCGEVCNVSKKQDLIKKEETNMDEKEEITPKTDMIEVPKSKLNEMQGFIDKIKEEKMKELLGKINDFKVDSELLKDSDLKTLDLISKVLDSIPKREENAIEEIDILEQLNKADDFMKKQKDWYGC